MFGVKVPLEGYIDMHCHIVPGVDDGARDMETAVEMAKMAYSDGIRTIIATPHYHPDKVSLTNEEVFEKFNEFKDRMQQEVPGLTFYFGREIYCDYDAVDTIKSGGVDPLLTMCGTNYVLVEFDVNTNYPYMKNQLKRLLMKGYAPVIAHIERYECLVSHPDLLWELKEMNMILQVNAMSVTGKTGKLTQKFVIKALKDGLVDLVASDAHTTRNRCPKLMEAAKMVGKKCGKGAVDRMFIENPQFIIDGKYMEETR